MKTTCVYADAIGWWGEMARYIRGQPTNFFNKPTSLPIRQRWIYRTLALRDPILMTDKELEFYQRVMIPSSFTGESIPVKVISKGRLDEVIEM